MRWQVEVACHEARYLSVETERQWADLAVLRTIPTLLGLYSVVTLLAHQRLYADSPPGNVRQAAWFAKDAPTFIDALALVRRQLWTQMVFRHRSNL